MAEEVINSANVEVEADGRNIPVQHPGQSLFEGALEPTEGVAKVLSVEELKKIKISVSMPPINIFVGDDLDDETLEDIVAAQENGENLREILGACYDEYWADDFVDKNYNISFTL